MKVLFVPLTEKGHVNPLIGVLQHLQKAGHHLACYGIRRDPIVEQFLTAGVTCSWFPTQGGGSWTASARKTNELRDPKQLLRWCALGIAKGLDSKSVDDLRSAIKEFKPDVLCVDPLAYGGCVAAELEGIPWAAISPLMVASSDPAWPCPWIDVMSELQPLIQEEVRKRGAARLRLHSCEAVSPWLNTVFVTEAFAPRTWSKNRHSWYLGPSRPLGRRGDETDFPWSRLRQDVPIVYVSGGGGQSLSFEPRTILSICRSLSVHEAQFVCALQNLFDDALVGQLPDSCIAVRNAPQTKLLERHAAIVVTHGGANTVAECLTYGRPMLALPIGFDQPLQAKAIETRGVGLCINPSELTEQSCRAALLRLLDASEGFSRPLEKIRRSYSFDGAAKAAELISALARTRRPLPPPLVERPEAKI